MTHPPVLELGIEAIRPRLPERVDAALRGDATVVTRHGRPVAALVPLQAWAGGQRPAGRPCADSRGLAAGLDLWGPEPATQVEALRDEWGA